MSVVPPGWYQDPEGPPGQARYWDGRGWGPAQQPGPSMGQGNWWVPLVVAVAVALLAALAWWGLPRLLNPSPVEPSPSVTADETTPETSPTATPEGTGGGEAGELNCAGARSSNFPKGPEFRVAGIVVPFPDQDWGFRFDASQWTWINDLYAWGKIIDSKESWVAGIAAGRLEAGNGFGAPEPAAEAVVECLTTYGVLNDFDEAPETVSSEAVTVDGMKGWQIVLKQPQAGQYGSITLRIIVLDAGQEDNLALAMGFHPTGHQETQSIVDQSLDGITRQ